MRAYETTFILVPSLDTEGIQTEIDAIKNVITTAGGEITAEKEWGRRRLAYPIMKNSEGIYHILRFSLDPKGLPELDRYYKLHETVLRALVILDENTPLDYIGQASEPEDRDSRDGGYERRPRGDRDRDGDDRDRDRRPRPRPADSAPAPVAAATAPATTTTVSAESESTKSGGEETS